MEDTTNYLSVLNPEQLEAVCHTGSPLLILAGAGSGKTRVITAKIAWLIAEKGVLPESILAVTFTNKAAREMSERAKRFEPRAERSIIRTFHSFGAWLLRRYAEWAGLSPQFTIYDDDDSVTLLMKAQPQLNKQEAQGFMRKISRAKDYCLTPDDPQLKAIDPDPEFAVIYREYQKRLQETGNADFGDLIMLPVRLLQEHPAISGHLHSRFKVILVDEYQDSNGAQFQLLKEMTGPNTYVCVVGDDDQSIYRFRGAEVQNILTFDRHFAHTKTIRLVRNYRSYDPILRVADSIVSRNEGRLGKTLIAARGTNGQKPRVYYLPSQEAEAELCVRLIKESVKNGASYSDWAILYRTNAQSLNFETAFLHEKIPHKVVGTVKFYEREEIKDALALLALIANGRDEIAFRRMVNKPARGIGEVTQNKIIAYARKELFSAVQDPLRVQEDLLPAVNGTGDARLPPAESSSQDFISVLLAAGNRLALSKKAAATLQGFLNCLKTLRTALTEGSGSGAAAEFSDQKPAGEGLAAFVLAVIEDSGLAAFHQNQDEIMGTQKTANLQELANTAALYPYSPLGLTAFLEHIELDRSLAEQTEEGAAVQLITMHNTKGLEFRYVIITGLENGIFPRNDESSEDMEEERRLMYVACTRAQDSLYMTSCAARRMYGRLAFMQPSRFLMEIESGLVESSGQPLAAFSPPADEEAALWRCGQRLFHDDYGYGYVVQSRQTGGELVITVQFETGYQKRFFPAYQRHELFRVSE
ncbi:MAG: UvrD-helicase domain-containing protein [Treponema sp.]